MSQRLKMLQLKEAKESVANNRKWLWTTFLLWITCFFLSFTAAEYAGSRDPEDVLLSAIVLNFTIVYIVSWPFAYFILLFFYYRNKRKVRYLYADLY